MTLVPYDPTQWTGRVDEDPAGWTGRWHQVVADADQTDIGGLVLLGFASDAGVRRNLGRPGAAAGPSALRRALSPLTLPAWAPILDAGDVRCDDDALEEAQAAFAARAAPWLARGAYVVGLGGGHEIAWASWQALASVQQGAPRIAIINLDAHLDLRDAPRPNSGTPFRQIAQDAAARGWAFDYTCIGVNRHANTTALLHRAQSLGVTIVYDEDVSAPSGPQFFPEQRPVPSRAAAAIDAALARADQVYLTICLDVLPADVAPGVSAPAAYGVDLRLVESLALQVARSGKLRLFDVAELNPAFDVDNRTARVGARLIASVSQRLLGMAR